MADVLNPTHALASPRRPGAGQPAKLHAPVAKVPAFDSAQSAHIRQLAASVELPVSTLRASKSAPTTPLQSNGPVRPYGAASGGAPTSPTTSTGPRPASHDWSVQARRVADMRPHVRSWAYTDANRNRFNAWQQAWTKEHASLSPGEQAAAYRKALSRMHTVWVQRMKAQSALWWRMNNGRKFGHSAVLPPIDDSNCISQEDIDAVRDEWLARLATIRQMAIDECGVAAEDYLEHYAVDPFM